jgi:hypothetical protein
LTAHLLNSQEHKFEGKRTNVDGEVKLFVIAQFLCFEQNLEAVASRLVAKEKEADPDIWRFKHSHVELATTQISRENGGH